MTEQANFAENTLNIIYKQQKSQEFCDIQISINNETIRAHRCVIAAQSDKICQLIKETTSNEVGETQINLTEFVPSLKIFESVLEFYYTGQLSDKNSTDLHSLKEAAIKLCSQELLEKLNELERLENFPPLSASSIERVNPISWSKTPMKNKDKKATPLKTNNKVNI